MVGRRVVVTGGARGIGLAVARAAADKGARVMIGDRDFDEASRVVVDLGGSHQAIKLDVSDEGSVVEMANAALRLFGQIDAFIHCAGVGLHRPLLETSVTELRAVVDIDLIGSYLCLREIARAMRSGGGPGSIVLVGSVAATTPSIGTTAYSAAKGGVMAMARAAAVELAKYDLRVNVINPGAVDTPLVQALHSPPFRAAYEARVPMGRYAKPAEIASVALFLASEQSSYLSGQAINVDGAFSTAGVML